jgi:N-sulfoglucosamine sulfohydrolase
MTRPNILQITTHDSGRHVGCYGHPTLRTPNIDVLAADGVRLTNYFAVCPICCASRATMLTGRYPQSHGLMDLCFSPFDWALGPDEQHITHVLAQAGYRNLLFGIQHEVDHRDIGRLAFDKTYPCVADGRTRTAPDIAADVTAFLESPEAGGDRPFYAQIGFFETHTPFDFGGCEPDSANGVVVPPYLVEDETTRAMMAGYQGAVRRADEAVGRIVEALDRNGLAEDTILVFTTDHGIELPRAKWFCYDPGIAIACIFRWPGGRLAGGRPCEQLLSNVDYLPTVLDLAGVAVPDRVQGRSFAGALRDDSASPVRQAVYAMYHKTQSRCVRTERHKFIRHFDAATDFGSVPVRFADVLSKRPIRRTELYDLSVDPNEFENLINRPAVADVQRRLDAMLWKWMASVGDPLLSGPVATPSYQAAMGEYRQWQSEA